ncbi:MAG: elongation factor G [Pirellulales bacterium]|nr:elongation factor G [Pirellulales bacterium]
MAKYNVDDVRGLVLCGHGSAGKTTLLDALLNATGAVKRQASVDDGTSICDFDEEEKAHRYTIESKLTHFDHAGKHFQVLDTPGYPDFIGQTIGAMRGVDTAAVVINAQSGIEVNTRRVFAEAKKAGLGRILVVNKLDMDNVDFPSLLETIQEVFGAECVPLNVPLGHGAGFQGVASTLTVPADTAGALVDPAEINEPLLDSVIAVDDAVMERYLEGQAPTSEEIARLIVRAVAEGNLIPVVCCSGKTGVGLPELLDALALCALPPGMVAPPAKDAAGNAVEVKPDPAGPLVAQVFKTRIDPFVQKLSFIRVFSGRLAKDMTVPVVGARKGVKLNQLFAVQASETEPVDEAVPGMIVAVAKMEELETGGCLGEVALAPIAFPRPMVGLAVTPKSRGDQTKLSGALNKIAQEDPTFHRELDSQTKETVINGMSELHLQIIQERLKRREKVEVETKEPKIPYRETIQVKAEGSYRHKKQTGGSGQFGEVHIRMFPLPKGTNIEEYATKANFPSLKEPHYDPEWNFLWLDSVVGATIPGNFMPAIEKGFRARMERGVIAGCHVQDVCVEVHFGKHHPVDSNEQAFKTAASMVFRNVFLDAKPGLLEPIVKLEVTVPADKVGDINSDMSGRRGRVLGMDSAGGGMQTVTVEVPLAEVTTYARSLSSITGGQGSYVMEFSHYDVVPGNVQKEIIDKAALKEEEEE